MRHAPGDWQVTRRLTFPAFLVIGLASAHGQFDAEVSMERSEFLQYEPVEITIQIANESSEPIDLPRMSPERPWLDLMVTAQDDTAIPRTAAPWKLPRITVLPGQSKAVSINLSPLFLIRDPGEYRVFSQIFLGNRRISGRPIIFCVSKGVTIWRQNFVAPADPADASKKPRPRAYSLVVHRTEARHMLYARIQNPEASRVFCTTALGPLIRAPETPARVDPQGDLHVFYQSGARVFSYARLSASGKMLGTRTFANLTSTPELVTLGDDEVEVVGGEEILPDQKNREQIIPTAPLARIPPSLSAPSKKK